MRWLLVKDLRILWRSPVMVGALVLYPIVIALLIGFALSSPPSRPKVAIYSGVPVGQGSIELGSQHLDIARLTHELYGSIEPLHAGSPAQALADVHDGKALAALIIPADIDEQLQNLIRTGEGNPTVRVVFNSRNPLERNIAREAIQSRVDDVQQAVSKALMQTVTADLQKVLDGGTISVLGRTIDLLGLKGTRAIAQSTVDQLPHHPQLTAALRQVVDFASIALEGFAVVSPDIGEISQPLNVQESDLSGSTTPTSAYAVAVAAVVLLMLVTLLIAAGMLANERSENAYRRLVRGLVRPEALLVEKVVLAAVCALAMALAMAAVVSLFIPLDWARFALWLAALGLGAVAFAALGVALGALARDVSVASLLAFLIALPVAFVALVPSGSVASGLRTVLDVISFLFPFRAALEAVSNAFNATPPAIGLPLVHLAVLALVFTALARVALIRFADR